MRRSRLIVLLVSAAALGAMVAPAAASALTVTSPTNNSVLTPQVSLSSPGSGPLLTPNPVLTGTAGVAPGDQSTVTITVYPGADTSQPAVEPVSGRVRGDGTFGIAIAPGLPDGQYTAVASQTGVAGTGVSGPQTFRIKAHPPAVTLVTPAGGSHPVEGTLVFAGSAGDVLGDSPQVALSLYSGSSTDDQLVGTIVISRSGTAWSARWPTPLAPGLYTAQAGQTDDAAHAGFSNASTFILAPVPNTLGPTVTLSRSGRVTVSLTCGAPAGLSCTGSVLVVTHRRFQPVLSGPKGPLRLMFLRASIPSGQTGVLSALITKASATALRHAHGVGLKVQTAIGAGDGGSYTTSTTRRLKVAK